MKLLAQFVILTMFVTGGSAVAGNFISADNPGFQYFGRCDGSNKKEVIFDWPGVYITCAFDGTACRSVMKGRNTFDVYVDGQYQCIVDVKAEKDTFLLVDKLKKGKHELKIVKRTESNGNATSFYGLMLDNGAQIYRSVKKTSHRIEFIGDSYTAGFGNEYLSRDCPPEQADSLMYSTTNTAKSFGALIAARFNAQYQINAISGKGLIRNFNGIDKGKEFLSCYERTLQSSINNTGISSLPWDFSTWHPEVIVICMGINDFQADPPYSDSVVFDSTYSNFVKFLQAKHPGVKIVCCATQVWPTKAFIPRIRKIVEDFRGEGNNNVIYFEFETENTALFGHPSIKDHEKIAFELGTLIKSVTGWKEIIKE